MMRRPRSGDDLGDMFVVLEPPPGGLTRFRARRERRRPRVWPWALACATAAAVAAVVVGTRTPARGLDWVSAAAELHPRWVGLGQVAAPREPMTLSTELAGALAARRVETGDEAVVFYMLDER